MGTIKREERWLLTLSEYSGGLFYLFYEYDIRTIGPIAYHFVPVGKSLSDYRDEEVSLMGNAHIEDLMKVMEADSRIYWRTEGRFIKGDSHSIRIKVTKDQTYETWVWD